MIELIITIIIAILVIWLVLKIVKKVIKAIMLIALIFIVAIGIIGGIIYMDYSYYINKEEYNLNIYLEGDELFGLSIPYANDEFDIQNVKSANSYSNELLLEDLDDEDLYIVLDKDFYPELLEDDYNYIGIELTKEEILQILNSNDPEKEVEDILGVLGLAGLTAATTISGLTIKEFIFSITMQDLFEDKGQMITLFGAFKEDELRVYPERFSLRLIKKYVPYTIIKDKLTFTE